MANIDSFGKNDGVQLKDKIGQFPEVEAAMRVLALFLIVSSSEELSSDMEVADHKGGIRRFHFKITRVV